MADKAGVELQAAVNEARQWIESVTGKHLVGEFRESLEDGIILCELINELNPGCIRKINAKNIAIAHLDNLKQFLSGCETLGLKDSQLFDLTDLQAPGTLRMKSGGVKHTTADRRLRNVVITLYWLGRKVAQTPSYKGPQLNLEAFKEILDIPNQNYYLKGYDGINSSSPVQTRSATKKTEPPTTKVTKISHTPSPPTIPSLPKPTIAAPVKPVKPVPPPTSTKEDLFTNNNNDISAEELMANIQSVVDELHLDYRSLSNGSPEIRKNSPVTLTNNKEEVVGGEEEREEDENISFTTTVTAVGGSFGLQIIGGADSAVPAQIELLLPGGPAETSGLIPHDLIVSINGKDVSGYNHFDLISLIKQSSAKGFVTMGVVRRPPSADSPEDGREGGEIFQRTESQIIWEEEHKERERQRQEVAILYNNKQQQQQEEEEEDNWEELLDEQLQWQSKPLDDLQHQLDALRLLAEGRPPPGNERKLSPGSDRKSSSPVSSTTAMSSIKPYNEEEQEIVRVEEEENDDTTPVASDSEEEEEEREEEEEEREEIKETVRGEGEGREADPVIVTHTDRTSPPMTTYSMITHETKKQHGTTPLTTKSYETKIEEDPFAPLKTTPSTQSELLQEVLASHTSLANGFDNIKTTIVSTSSRSYNTTPSYNTTSTTSYNTRNTAYNNTTSSYNTSHTTTNTSYSTSTTPYTNSTSASAYTNSTSASAYTNSTSTSMYNSKQNEGTKFRQFNTPNARVVSMDFNGQESEEMFQGVKVKAVQKTRWTPEMKAKQRTTPSGRGASVTTPNSAVPPGYEKYEVVVTDPRGRSLSYGPQEEQRMQQFVTRPNSGQVRSGKRPPNCTHCRSPITRGPMMSIPARKIHFHSKCLICVVCKSHLTLSGHGQTTVFLRHSLPHCSHCYSTDNGIKATTC